MSIDVNFFLKTLRAGAYPMALMLAPCLAWWASVQGVHEVWVLGGVGLSVVLALSILERVIPQHAQWGEDHGDTRTDLLHHAHALVIPGIHQWSIATLGLLAWPPLHGLMDGSLWPTGWLFALQVALALVVMDVGTYWGHRLVHRVPWLWRLHEVHHSAPRLYWLNAQRFHPLDLWVIQGFALIPLLCLGAPTRVVLVLSALSMTHALFQHSNIRQHTRLLDPLLSTANVHRWHHAHGPKHVNFGGILSLWDGLFGTRGAQSAAPTPAQLTQHASEVPRGFFGQLAHPWRRAQPHSPRSTP